MRTGQRLKEKLSKKVVARNPQYSTLEELENRYHGFKQQLEHEKNIDYKKLCQDVKKMHDGLRLIFSLDDPHRLTRLQIKAAILLGKAMIHSNENALNIFHYRIPYYNALAFFKYSSQND